MLLRKNQVIHMYTIIDLKNTEKALIQLTLGEKVVSFCRSTSVGTQTVTLTKLKSQILNAYALKSNVI